MHIGASLEGIMGRVPPHGGAESGIEAIMAMITAAAADYGLAFVEVPMDAAFIYPSLFNPRNLEVMRRRAQEGALSFSLHLPYMWLDLGSLNEGIRQASVYAVLRALELAQPLKPLAYCLHLTGDRSEIIATSDWPDREKQAFLKRILEQANRSLRELLTVASTEKLCIENTAGMPVALMLPLLERHNVRLCLDVGHLALQGEDPLSFLEQHFPMVGMVHLHDVARKRTAKRATVLVDHQPLGTGFLPLREILDTLSQRSYNGLITLELFEREHLAASAETLKSWLSSPLV